MIRSTGSSRSTNVKVFESWYIIRLFTASRSKNASLSNPFRPRLVRCRRTLPQSTLVGAVWLCGNWSGWTTSAFLMTDTRGFAVHYIHQAQTKGIYLREWWIVQGLYTFGRFYRNYQFKLSSSSSSFPDFFFLFFFFIHSESIWRVFFYQRTVSLLFTLFLLLLLGVDSKNLSRYGPDLSG